MATAKERAEAAQKAAEEARAAMAGVTTETGPVATGTDTTQADTTTTVTVSDPIPSLDLATEEGLITDGTDDASPKGQVKSAFSALISAIGALPAYVALHLADELDELGAAIQRLE